MFSSEEVLNLATYFQEVERFMLEEIDRIDPPEEREITRRLIAALDKTRTWEIEGYNHSDWLAIHISGSSSFSIKIQKHPTHWENRVSNADYGLVFKFIDGIEDVYKQETAYLVQAKKLYQNADYKYTFQSKFKAKEIGQENNIKALSKYIGKESIKFAAYCPRLSYFSNNVLEHVVEQHRKNIFSLPAETRLVHNLRQEVSIDKPEVSQSGFWICPISSKLRCYADIHETAFTEKLPFGWFVIANIWGLGAFGNKPDSFPRSNAEKYSKSTMQEEFISVFGLNFGYSERQQRLVHGLAIGDQEIAKEIASISGGSVPKSMFLPPITLEIIFDQSSSRGPAPVPHDHARARTSPPAPGSGAG